MIALDRISGSTKIFLASFFTSLCIALINGYPLLFPDSFGYLGFSPWVGSGGFRSITLDFLARPLYPFLGVWSVIFVQATAFSYVMTLFASFYLEHVKAFELSVLIIISQLPFYVAFVMADIWLVILVLAFLSVINEFRWLTLFILAVAITVHGSHFYIFIASSIMAIFMFKNRVGILKVFCLSIACAIVFTGIVNGLMSHNKNKELSWSLVGSKILVQVPGAIDLKCAQDPKYLMCPYKETIQAGVSKWCYDLPDCFIWEKQSFFRDIDHSKLKAASRELLAFTILNLPVAFIKATMADLISFYGIKYDDQFSPLARAEKGIDPELVGEPLHPEGKIVFNPDYERSLQAAGKWTQPKMSRFLVGLRLFTHIIGTICIILSLFLNLRVATKVGLFCIAVLLINDLLFAACSGSYMRYHDRGLFLMIIPVLLVINERRKRREVVC